MNENVSVSIVFNDMNDVNKVRNFINELGQEIEHEYSREDAIKFCKKLLADGTYNSQPGTDRDGNPLKVWTVEDLLEQLGWQDDEVYWFSILSPRVGYSYQLILKPGDIIAKFSDRYNLVTI